MFWESKIPYGFWICSARFECDDDLPLLFGVNNCTDVCVSWFWCRIARAIPKLQRIMRFYIWHLNGFVCVCTTHSCCIDEFRYTFKYI